MLIALEGDEVSTDVDNVTLEEELFPPEVDNNDDEMLLFQPGQPEAEHVEVTVVKVYMAVMGTVSVTHSLCQIVTVGTEHEAEDAGPQPLLVVRVMGKHLV